MDATPRFPNVMLLAAGLGTRLRPLTDIKPKPLTDVGSITLIDRVIANARAEGAEKFVVNAHHLAAQITAHFAGHKDFSILREEALLGTGGGVRNGLSALKSDPILVMNTDAFWLPGADRPLKRLLARHDAARAQITLLCVHPLRAIGFARSHDFCLDPLGRVTYDSGAPVIYGGVAVIERAAFEGTREGAFSLNMLFEKALAAEALAGAMLDASWFHVGDQEALAQAREAVR